MNDTDRLQTGEWLVVLDGAKLLVFENEGSVIKPSLGLRLERGLENEPARDLGSDRPGRVHASVGGMRSSVAQTDLHQAAEDDFVRSAVESVADLCRDGAVRSLVVVAPPRAIATFRSAVNPDLKRRVRHEIVADLVKMPVSELERRFTPA